jgi:hypothetical protein
MTTASGTTEMHGRFKGVLMSLHEDRVLIVVKRIVALLHTERSQVLRAVQR